MVVYDTYAALDAAGLRNGMHLGPFRVFGTLPQATSRPDASASMSESPCKDKNPHFDSRIIRRKS